MNTERLTAALRTLTTAGKTTAIRIWHHIDRPTVISIRCPQCGSWVPPGQYNPRTNLCRRCNRPAVAYARFRAARIAMA